MEEFDLTSGPFRPRDTEPRDAPGPDPRSSAADRSFFLHHAPFVLFSVATFLVLALGSLFYVTLGRSLFEAPASSSTSTVAGWTGGRRLYVDVAHEVYSASVATMLTVYGLVALIYILRRNRVRWMLHVLALALFYLAVETLAGPHVTYVLGLTESYLVKNVDHWPTITDASFGWNGDSVRTPREASEFRDEDFNLIFLGDSFTLGLGLTADQTFAHKCEAELRRTFPQQGIHVANFGWVSSSPLLSYRRLLHLGERYRPDLVVLCIDMTDFGDDLRYAAKLEKHGIYRYYDRFPLALGILRKVSPLTLRDLHYNSLRDLPRKRFFVTEWPLAKSRPYLAPLVANLELIHEWCRDRGVGFTVFVLPRGYQYSDRESPRNWEAKQYTALGPHCHAPFQFFAEIAPTVDFQIHSLLPAFQESGVFPTCFPHDPHWNDAGTTIAAQAMVPVLAEQIRAR